MASAVRARKPSGPPGRGSAFVAVKRPGTIYWPRL